MARKAGEGKMELSELGLDLRRRCNIFPPESEQSQRLISGFIGASTWGHIYEQIPDSQVEFCPFYKTAALRLAGYGDPPEWKRKRERILFAELLEEIPDLEEPDEDQEQWVKKRMSGPRWERWDRHAEEWTPFSRIDGEAINVWRYNSKK